MAPLKSGMPAPPLRSCVLLRTELKRNLTPLFSSGNELWEFDERGLMRRREASINDVFIAEANRKFFWPAPGPRPADHTGIPDVR
jgi:nuclear transport factor 2 (NTF2) superfamily protein